MRLALTVTVRELVLTPSDPVPQHSTVASARPALKHCLLLSEVGGVEGAIPYHTPPPGAQPVPCLGFQSRVP